MQFPGNVVSVAVDWNRALAAAQVFALIVKSARSGGERPFTRLIRERLRDLRAELPVTCFRAEVKPRPITGARLSTPKLKMLMEKAVSIRLKPKRDFFDLMRKYFIFADSGESADRENVELESEAGQLISQPSTKTCLGSEKLIALAMTSCSASMAPATLRPHEIHPHHCLHGLRLRRRVFHPPRREKILRCCARIRLVRIRLHMRSPHGNR